MKTSAPISTVHSFSTVIKRDRSQVPFDRSKIVFAIKKAGNATGCALFISYSSR
jgi:transcriptional regulator NrdR family protein